MQKLDIAVYDNNFRRHLIKDIVLSDTEELNRIQVGHGLRHTPAKAIIINHGDHAYAKLRFDVNSFDTFENELYKIGDSLSRAFIWRSLWNHVMDEKISSLWYYSFAVKQLPYQKV